MKIQAGFIFKILALSTVLSFLLKYGGRYLLLKPTTTTALIIVLMPSLVTGLVLGWRYYSNSRSSEIHPGSSWLKGKG